MLQTAPTTTVMFEGGRKSRLLSKRSSMVKPVFSPPPPRIKLDDCLKALSHQSVVLPTQHAGNREMAVFPRPGSSQAAFKSDKSQYRLHQRKQKTSHKHHTSYDDVRPSFGLGYRNTVIAMDNMLLGGVGGDASTVQLKPKKYNLDKSIQDNTGPSDTELLAIEEIISKNILNSGDIGNQCHDSGTKLPRMKTPKIKTSSIPYAQQPPPKESSDQLTEEEALKKQNLELSKQCLTLLTKQVGSLQSYNASLSQKIKTIRDENEELKAEKNEYSYTLNGLKDEVSKLRLDKDKLREELRGVEDTLQLLRNESVMGELFWTTFSRDKIRSDSPGMTPAIPEWEDYTPGHRIQCSSPGDMCEIVYRDEHTGEVMLYEDDQAGNIKFSNVVQFRSVDNLLANKGNVNNRKIPGKSILKNTDYQGKSQGPLIIKKCINPKKLQGMRLSF